MAILDNFPVLTRDNVIDVGTNPFLMCPADQMCALIKGIPQDILSIRHSEYPGVSRILAV